MGLGETIGEAPAHRQPAPLCYGVALAGLDDVTAHRRPLRVDPSNRRQEMSAKAEKLADEASERWTNRPNEPKPATDPQYALLHKLIDQAPLSTRQASNLINVLSNVISGKLI